MISAVIGEELGLVGIVGVVGLFATLRLRRPAGRQKSQGQLRQAAGRRPDLADPRPGDDQPLRGDGAGAADRRAAAVRLLRQQQPAGDPVRRRADPQRGARRDRPRWQTARRRGRAHAQPAEGADRAVPRRRRVVVAAGGTAGHVVPAMAVADELRASGAEVSFLGTRERIEAELVPAAGYEIDFIKVRGIDRRNPLRAAGAALEALGAVGRPRRAILRARGRRRRDGRRRLRRRPGRARRAARPGRRSSSPRPTATSASPTGCWPAARGASASPSRSRAARASATWSPAGRCRPPCSPPTATRRASASASTAGDALPAGHGRQPGRPLDQPLRDRGARRARGPRLPRRPPGRAPRLRRAARSASRARRTATRYTLLDYEPDLGDCLAACDLVLGRSGGSIFEVAAAGPAGDPRPLSARDRRPPERQRRLDGGGRRGGRDRGRGDERRRGSPPRSAPCSATRRGWRRWRPPRPALAKPDAARRIADEVLTQPASARQSRKAGASGGLGRAAAALHRHRRRRDERPGAGLRAARRRASPAATAPTPLIWSGCARPGSSRSIGHDAANLPDGAEVVVSTAIGEDNPELAAARERGARGPPPRRAAGRALRREAPDRGRRHPRQDDDDARWLAWALRATGRRPGLLRRRRGARASARTAMPPTPAGGRASGSSPRPTRATPASSS